MADIAIVGAGVTGLACAAEIGSGAVVVDRIPVAGGVLGWDHPAVGALRGAAEAAGARLHLGETAIRWDGRTLTAIGPEGVRRITAAALVIAAGARPRGRAELGLAGPRPAGILPATVACHLTETGLLLGRRPAVIGSGDWALRTVEHLLHAGVEELSVISPGGLLRRLPDDPRIEVHLGARPVGVVGEHRVSGVELENGARIGCDAVALAHGLVPLRNVDGAVWDGAHTVYAQPLDDPGSIDAAAEAGRACAAAALEHAA